jgi:hypothetical protein
MYVVLYTAKYSFANPLAQKQWFTVAYLMVPNTRRRESGHGFVQYAFLKK